MATNDTISQCVDPRYIFQSFDNLGNCYNAIGGTLGPNITNVVETCLNDYCKNPYPALGGCGNWNGTASLPFIVSTTKGNQYFWNNDTCAGVKDGINTDIGGPGVFVSYLMQLGMVLYFWFLLHSFRLFPSIISFCTRTRQSQKTSPPTYQIKGDIIRHYFTRHDHILKVILLEFQEAQCFFMIASQAAILLATKSTTIFQSNTMPSLWANNGFAGVVSSAGILPIVMVATVIVSEFSLYWTYETPSVDQLSTFDYNEWPESYGGYVPPLIYCTNQTEDFYLRVPILFFWQVLNPYCLVVFGLDVILWLQPYVVKMADNEASRGGYWAKFIRLDLPNISLKAQQLATSTWGKWVRKLHGLLTFLVESLFLVAVFLECLCFAEFGHLRAIDFSAWGFGQIVALTIWFPVASKHIYLVLFGTESYSQARTPKSDYTDKDKEKSDKNTDDIESQAPQSSNIIDHIHQKGGEASQ
ncbi:hypothetical protein EYB25_002679 [Talaromyces marneffei]|uniref:uncharacterized protein n=1 Tax=Talaromyces marneffei TaxID=37727 RepID=UPI0012A7DA76|nr:uncharacterized protein EYB26_002693 [Talaromyces marneffei]KAE8554141.1 hypothetical protein EYB25_002679 [Talaromyces marneffei]QGA15037.1 hypothetical protein EYB26_002693 [Talaromyces marneffei]